jgi:hypothetical protein
MPTRPPIRILAPPTNTGDLFGRLVGDLFVALGYDEPHLNVHKTGREIDIEARHRTEPRSMRAECKATAAPIGGADLNKFAGALERERRTPPSEPIYGYFVSLSGFTESARAQEGEGGDSPRMTLLDGRRVVEELIKGHVIVPPTQALACAGRCAAGAVPDLIAEEWPQLLAHDIGWIWAVHFQRHAETTHFALIHADGEALSPNLARQVVDQDREQEGNLHQLAYLPPDAPPEADTRAAEAKSAYLAYLATECGDIELEGLPPDQDGARRFRLESLFVPLRLVPIPAVKEARDDETPPHQLPPQPRPVGEALASHPHLAILAHPGGGKTTLIKRLAIAYAFPERRRELGDPLPDRDRFPLLLRCRQLRGRGLEPLTRLLGQLGQAAELGDLADSLQALVQATLREGRALLLIDGLDEITDLRERGAFVAQVRTFLSTYPGVDTVITSREAGFRSVAGVLAGHCAHYRIADFDRADVERLCVSWHREVVGDRAEVEAQARKLATAIWVDDRVRRLAVSPLLLTTLLLVRRWLGQLTSRRTVLYDKAIEVLLGTWNLQGHEPIDVQEVVPQLAFVAWQMMEAGVQRISRPRLRVALQAARSQMPDVLAHATLGVDELIERVEGRSSLLVLAGHEIEDGRLVAVYEFQHLTFQEFLAARALVDQYYPDRLPADTLLSKLEPHLADPAWKEVIPLAAALAGRAAAALMEPLVKDCEEHVALHPSFRPPPTPMVATTLAQCLLDEVQIAPPLLERGLLAIAELMNPNPATRQLVYPLACSKYGNLFRDLLWREFAAGKSRLLSLGESLRVAGYAELGWSQEPALDADVASRLDSLLGSNAPRERAIGLLAAMQLSYRAAGSSPEPYCPSDIKLSRWLPEVVAAIQSPHRWEQFSGAWALAGLTEAEIQPGNPVAVIQKILGLMAADSSTDLRYVCCAALLQIHPPTPRTTFVAPPPAQVAAVASLFDPEWNFEMGWLGGWAALFSAFYWRQPWSDEELCRRFGELIGSPAETLFPSNSPLVLSNVGLLLNQLGKAAAGVVDLLHQRLEPLHLSRRSPRREPAAVPQSSDVPAPIVARQRLQARALLIGIDRYPNLPMHLQLSSCVNDVEALASLLIDRFSFPAENVVKLVDADATRDGILAAMQRLLTITAPGDVVLIHYSGHGSQAPDLSGEADRWNTFVPYDSGRVTLPNLDIHFQEVYPFLLELCGRCSHLTFIMDCSHSGPVLRDAFGSKARFLPPDSRSQTQHEPTLPRDAGTAADNAAKGGGPDLLLPTDRLRYPMPRSYTQLAACRASETSFENMAEGAGGVRHGAFTYFLCQALASIRKGTTFGDLFEEVAPQVTAHYPTQHPQLLGDPEQAVFGLLDLEPRYLVPVRTEGGMVLLEAGAAAGVTIGSTWLVYPPFGHLPAAASPLARVEVTRVGARASEARVLEGEITVPGAQAVEHTHRYSEARLGVEIDPSASRLPAAAVKLQTRIESSPLLRLASRGAVARVYLLPARSEVTPADPVPTAGPLARDSWAIVGSDGELCIPVRGAAETGVVAGLLDNLEKLARFRFALELADPGGPLSGKVNLGILRREGERWIDADADLVDFPVFHDGDAIAFRITHTHPLPLYLYLLDFSISGAIRPIYPPSGQQQPASHDGGAIMVGTHQYDTMTISLPRGFPYGERPAAGRTGWVETVKLFATTREVDFSSLSQSGQGYREPSRAFDNPLSRLLRGSLVGASVRSAEVGQSIDDGDWTVVQRSFRLLP